MLRVDLHNKVSTYLTDRRLLGDLRTTGACYTDEGVAEPMDDPNPAFCVRHGPLGTSCPLFLRSKAYEQWNSDGNMLFRYV